MSSSIPIRNLERFVSFGGICGIIGVICDLMAPVGSYTLWALLVGVVTLLAGLVFLVMRGKTDQVAQSMSAFGTLLVTISIGFMAFAPDGDRGVLATEFTWVGDAQSELLGIKEVALKIAGDTSKIADNTSQIASTSNQIASDTEIVRNLSFTMDGFLEALASYDDVNVRAYCARGYRIYQTGFLLQPDRYSATSRPQLEDRNFRLLSELDCFDTERLCDTSQWNGLGLDPRRVAEQCGVAGVQRMAQIEVEKKQRELDAAERREECEAEAKADPMYEFWPQIMMIGC